MRKFSKIILSSILAIITVCLTACTRNTSENTEDVFINKYDEIYYTYDTINYEDTISLCLAFFVRGNGPGMQERFGPAPAGKEYCYIVATLRNLTNKEIPYDLNNFKTENSSGEIHDPCPEYMQMPTTGTIAPGGEIFVSIVFLEDPDDDIVLRYSRPEFKSFIRIEDNFDEFRELELREFNFADQEVKIGEEILCGDQSITINSLYTTNYEYHNTYTHSSSLDEYLVVDITLKNISLPETASYSSVLFRLGNVSGDIFEGTTMLDGFYDLPTDQLTSLLLNQGEEATKSVVFQKPSFDDGLVLHFLPPGHIQPVQIRIK